MYKNEIKEFDIDSNILKIISKELNIDEKYLIIKIRNMRFPQKLKNLRIFFNIEELISEPSKIRLKNKRILINSRDSLRFSFKENVYKNENDKLSDIFKDVERLECLFFNEIVKSFIDNDNYKIESKNGLLKKINKNNIENEYSYEKTLKVNFKRNVEDLIKESLFKYLFKNYLYINKDLDLKIKDLDMFYELFKTTNSDVLFVGSEAKLELTPEFEKYLQFEDIEGFNDMKDYLTLNFKI